jgi:ATP-dependent DNA helicase RecG
MADSLSENTLDKPVSALAGIGPLRAQLLAHLGIESIRDLLMHVPRAYQDRRAFRSIDELSAGQTVLVSGEVVRSVNRRLRGRNSMAVVTVSDPTGEIEATFFGRGFLAQTLRPGTRVVLYGKVEGQKRLAIKNPEYELLEENGEDLLNTGRIVPVYALTEKITQRMLRRWIAAAIDAFRSSVPETLPELLRSRYGFAPVAVALYNAHFPAELEQAEAARERFAYEELLAMQLAILQARAARFEPDAGIVHPTDGPLLNALKRGLPFTLTSAQHRAITDILGDMSSAFPMQRLLQGDVGSGKTVVALHAMAAAVDGAHQVALMAPTEVLAEQHYLTLRRSLEALGIQVALLTGSIRNAAALRQEISAHKWNVVVGTQALIQESTQFARLGLVIIDEQHRFGVAQRMLLEAKGEIPDVLHMTATPIPRTLAMTLYGGMDLTLIRELPPGRKPVKTLRIPDHKIKDLYRYIVEQAQAGFQTYYICPLVEESETLELAAVVSHFEALSAGPLADLRTELLHGRLDAREKESVLQRFQAGEIDVLFSTTVVEVGIDVANATTMVVENAGQFGLTQLHQLRGRVGRSTAQAHCFLLGKAATDDGRQRLEIICRSQDGFEIAEADLELRGPGEFYGLRQAGLTDLRVADLRRDADLLQRARRDAQEVLSNDPVLALADHPGLSRVVQRFRNLGGI